MAEMVWQHLQRAEKLVNSSTIYNADYSLI